jgi:hypothetical protein
MTFLFVRRIWNACVLKVTFNGTVGVGGSVIEQIDAATSDNSVDGVYAVQCFPLYSILLAVGRTHVDYFSLDVEGSEYKMLKTIPWSKVNIKVDYTFQFIYIMYM